MGKGFSSKVDLKKSTTENRQELLTLINDKKKNLKAIREREKKEIEKVQANEKMAEEKASEYKSAIKEQEKNKFKESNNFEKIR